MTTGYGDFDYERFHGESEQSHRATDARTPFMHDRDRVLYSRAFAALAGKTQVVSVSEMGSFHTRLTHSLKVEQLGRRMTEWLGAGAGRGPDPELVAAACLAHDIGHPPYGHIGEVAIQEAITEIILGEEGAAQSRDDNDRKDETTDADLEAVRGCSFEGNAQNLRILSGLEVRSTAATGLQLTRATLDAVIKYPWLRSEEKLVVGGTDRMRKFGIYDTDCKAAEWILGDRMLAGGEDNVRPVEEQIMDWADDVTYATHDVEDFFNAGLIPLDKLTDFSRTSQMGRLSLDRQAPPSLHSFLDRVAERWAKKDEELDRDEAYQLFGDLENLYHSIDPALAERHDRASLTKATSTLINELLKDVKLVSADQGKPLVRYEASLQIPERNRFRSRLLKELVWVYVIDNPALASQQHGQAQLMKSLINWHYQQPERLLPNARREELQQHHSPLRAVCDHVSSLTEPQALHLYRRMTGESPGFITDRLH